MRKIFKKFAKSSRKSNNKIKYCLMTIGCLAVTIVIALTVNYLYKTSVADLLQEDWSVGDALNYVATMIGAICTFILSIVAYKQNEKLQDMENSSYIANNSCMVLIEELTIETMCKIFTDYDYSQILIEEDNEEKLPSGYKVKVKLKKASKDMFAIPSLIRVEKCTLLIANEDGILESDLWLKNIRDGYTRVAIFEEGIVFNCDLLVEKTKQEKFINAIQKTGSRLTIEIEFDIVTDKYVSTRCKSRAYCNCSDNKEKIIWECKEPMVFFYGHELRREDIVVLGE